MIKTTIIVYSESTDEILGAFDTPEEAQNFINKTAQNDNDQSNKE